MSSGVNNAGLQKTGRVMMQCGRRPAKKRAGSRSGFSFVRCRRCDYRCAQSPMSELVVTAEVFEATYPVVVSQPVEWGSMDALGHLNNTVYFRYFENARIALFATWPMEPLGMERSVGAIVAETRCRFRRPVVFPDTVLVGSRVIEASADSAVIEHAIYSPKLGMVAAIGSASIVCYDYGAGRRAPWPPAVATILGLSNPSENP